MRRKRDGQGRKTEGGERGKGKGGKSIVYIAGLITTSKCPLTYPVLVNMSSAVGMSGTLN